MKAFISEVQFFWEVVVKEISIIFVARDEKFLYIAVFRRGSAAGLSSGITLVLFRDAVKV